MKWLQMWQQSPPYNLLDSNSNPDLNLSLFTAPVTPCDPRFQRSHRFTHRELSILVLSPPNPFIILAHQCLLDFPKSCSPHQFQKKIFSKSSMSSPHTLLNCLHWTFSWPNFYLFFLNWLMILTPTPASVPLFSPCLILTLTKTLAQVIKMEAIYNLP